MTKRILLSKVEDFEIFAEISSTIRPQGSVLLKILTRWTNANNPEECQVKFTMMVDRKSVNNLDVLSSKIKTLLEM